MSIIRFSAECWVCRRAGTWCAHGSPAVAAVLVDSNRRSAWDQTEIVCGACAHHLLTDDSTSPNARIMCPQDAEWHLWRRCQWDVVPGHAPFRDSGRQPAAQQWQCWSNRRCGRQHNADGTTLPVAAAAPAASSADGTTPLLTTVVPPGFHPMPAQQHAAPTVVAPGLHPMPAQQHAGPTAGDLPLYVVGPCLGGIIAALAFGYLDAAPQETSD